MDIEGFDDELRESMQLLMRMMSLADLSDPMLGPLIRMSQQTMSQLIAHGLKQQDLVAEAHELVKKMQSTTWRLGKDVEKLDNQVTELRTTAAADRRLRQRAENELTAVRDEPRSRPAPGGDKPPLLEDLLEETGAERDLLAGMLDDAEAERDEALRQRARIAIRLAELSPTHADAVYGQQEPEVQTFDCFQDVFAQRKHPLLVCTLDTGVAAALDRHANAPTYRRRTAAALSTMALYATLKAEARTAGREPGPDLANLGAFTRSGDLRISLSPASVAINEFELVTNTPELYQARVFLCPHEVDPTGRVAMLSHVRIGSGSPPAPRLHFFDATATTGQVVIGYLGPHLPNTKTYRT